MDPAAEVLVIFLSIFLFIFLLIGIILAIYLINLTRQIRKITNSAERTVYNIEKVVTGASKIISPIFLAEIIAKLVNKFKKSKKEKK